MADLPTGKQTLRGRSRKDRRGIALVVVLIVIAMLSLGAYTFSDLMIAERNGATLIGKQAQARAAAESGAEMARVFLEQDPLTQSSLGGTFDNATSFSNIAVTAADAAGAASRFSVVSAGVDDSGTPVAIRFGLEDESAKLNLNRLIEMDGQDAAASSGSSGTASGDPSTAATGGSADDSAGAAASDAGSADNSVAGQADDTAMAGEGPARDALMNLPGMTLDIADAILDWLDDDDQPREFGAEALMYSDQGFTPRNGPIESLDELLLISGVTPELLYGADRNRNGVIESSEQQMSLELQIDPALASLDRGWSAYLTVYSKEQNADVEGNPRINLNVSAEEDSAGLAEGGSANAGSSPDPADDAVDGADADSAGGSSVLEDLYNELATVFEPDWATFIVAYLQNGPYQEPSDDGNTNTNQPNGGQ